MLLIGRVLWWDYRDKEGIIIDAEGNEYFFNSSSFPDFSKFKSLEGRFVEFSLNKSVKHVRCASNILVVPLSAQSKIKKTFNAKPKSSVPEASV